MNNMQFAKTTCKCNTFTAAQYACLLTKLNYDNEILYQY